MHSKLWERKSDPLFIKCRINNFIDILVAILIYSVGRFIIKQIGVLIAKVLEKRKIETSVQTFLKGLVKILLNMVLAFAIISK